MESLDTGNGRSPIIKAEQVKQSATPYVIHSSASVAEDHFIPKALMVKQSEKKIEPTDPHREYLYSQYKSIAERLLRGELSPEDFANIQTDSDLKKEALATTDELTRLPNRRGFLNSAETMVWEARRKMYEGEIAPISILFMDIDNFKHYNDTFGHASGDGILRTLGKILKGNIRPNDVAGRWGGEECVVLVNADLEGALVVAKRIQESLDNFSQDKPFHLSVSVGISEYKPDEAIDDLINEGDQAMYYVKNNGRRGAAIWGLEEGSLQKVATSATENGLVFDKGIFRLSSTKPISPLDTV